MSCRHLLLIRRHLALRVRSLRTESSSTDTRTRCSCSRRSHSIATSRRQVARAEAAGYKLQLGTHAPSASDWRSPADDTRRPSLGVRLVGTHARRVLAQVGRRRHRDHGRLLLLLPGRHHLDVHVCACVGAAAARPGCRTGPSRSRKNGAGTTTPPMLTCRLNRKLQRRSEVPLPAQVRDRVGLAWCVAGRAIQAQSGSVNCQEGGPHRAC